MSAVPMMLAVIALMMSSDKQEKELAKLRAILAEKLSPEELELHGIRLQHEKPGIGTKLVWLVIILVPIVLILWNE